MPDRSKLKVGDYINGTIKGIAVAGWWEGRGIIVDNIPGLTLSTWAGLSGGLKRGYIDNQIVIEIGSTYILDFEDFHDRLIDNLHNAGLIFQVIPDEGDDEQWVAECPLDNLMALVENALKADG